MFKIKEGFTLHNTGNTYLVISSLPESSNTPHLFAINESGALLWNELTKGTDKSSLVKTLQKEYEADSTQILNDIEEFITNLQTMGVLDEQ